MSKVTSKLQVTLPKALAARYAIRPGDDIRFEGAGDVIRVVPSGAEAPPAGHAVEARLALFDAATERQEARQAGRRAPRPDSGRGWTREELYERGPDAD